MNKRGAVSWAGIAIVAVVVILVVGIWWYRHLQQLAALQAAPQHLNSGLSRAKRPAAGRRKPAPRILGIARPAFEISGPLKDRPIEHRVLPQYPEWAEEKGVQGKVRLYFKVTNQGEVGPNITVIQTMGYPEFDQVAIEALRQWRFAPAKLAERIPYQTGYINFNFWLEDRPTSP